MCNLYAAGPMPRADQSEWERGVRDAVGKLGIYRIGPGNQGVVARLIGGDVQAERMGWGFVRGFAKRPINNARDDKLSSPMWREAFEDRRCIIPVRWFVEWHPTECWKLTGARKVLAIRQATDSWLWMAGMWEGEGKDAAYTMITTEANSQLAPIHKRMPAILEPYTFVDYLAGGNPKDLIRPYSGDLEIVEMISPRDNPDHGPPKDDGGGQQLMTF